MAEPAAPLRGVKALKQTPANKDRLEVLGALQYTLAEVAEDYGASLAELTAFLDKWNVGRAIYEQAIADARRGMRAAQFKLGEKSPTVAIFLGKYYLGQAERRELDASARAEAAEDAGFVRAALATLAAARNAPGVVRSGGEG
jgi:hypothetical protein